MPVSVEFSEIVTVDSIPAVQLFFNSKMFLADYFRGARETAQIKDDKSKTTATKGSFPVTIENGDGDEIAAKVFFTLIIQLQENMYKYTLNDFYFAYTEETGITSYASFNDRIGVAMNKKQWQDVQAQTVEFVSGFIAELKGHMQQKEIPCKELAHSSSKKKNAASQSFRQ